MSAVVPRPATGLTPTGTVAVPLAPRVPRADAHPHRPASTTLHVSRAPPFPVNRSPEECRTLMRSVCIAVFAVAFGGTPFAQEPAVPARLSLEDALRIAEARNPQLVVAQQEVVGREADVLAARKRPNPFFTLSSEGIPLSQQNRPPFFDNQELTFGVQQELEPGGRRRLRTEQAQYGVDASRASARDAPPPAALRGPSRLHAGGPRQGGRRGGAHHTRGDRQGAGAEPGAVRTGRTVRRRAAPPAGGALPVRRRRVCGGTRAQNARSALLALLNLRPLDQPFEPSTRCCRRRLPRPRQRRPRPPTLRSAAR